MDNYHFLKVTEYFDKNYCCSSKKFAEKSLILYVVQEEQDFFLVTANVESRELVVFNPRKKKFVHSLETFTNDLLTYFTAVPCQEWTHDDTGICPLISPGISSGLIIAHLIKLISTGGCLDEFKSNLSVPSLECIKNQMVLELLSNKLM